jgi:hypothetical protein
MKKFLCFSCKIYFTLGFLLVGVIGAAFMKTPMPEALKFGDFIYIKNVKTNKYVTPYEKEITTLVGKKEQTQNAKFQILSAKRPNEKREVIFGDEVYFSSTSLKNEEVAYSVGNLDTSKHLIYGMKRTLLGLVAVTKEFDFEVMSDTKKAGEKVLFGDKLTLKVVPFNVLKKKSPDEYFRFNVDVSTFKGGPEIFISDDSKMTKLAQKWTKELTFEKAALEKEKLFRETLGKKLIDAVIKEKTNEIIQLLDEHPNLINYKDENQQTPLHWAAMKKNREIFSLLVERGADLKAVDRHGYIPIFYVGDKLKKEFEGLASISLPGKMGKP